MDSAACGSFAVLLLRRNCCEKHGCEEDCCEGTVENGLRRTGCCEEDYGERTTENGLLRRGRLRTDSPARGSSAVHIIAEWVHVHPQNSWPSRAQPWKAQNGTKVREGKRSPEMDTCKPALSLATLLLLSCFSLANTEMDTCKPALSLATLLLLSCFSLANAEMDICQRGDRHMPTRG